MEERIRMDTGAVEPLREICKGTPIARIAENLGMTRQSVWGMLKNSDTDLHVSTVMKIAKVQGWHLELVKD